jgi:outer membrane lipoprotein-sorting protein
MNKSVSLTVVCLLAMLLSSTQALAITAEELADICEAMEKNIQDIYLEFEWGLDPPPDISGMPGNNFLMTTGPTRITWATKRPFGQFSLSTDKETLVDQYGTAQKETIRQSYNGKVAKRFQESISQRRNDILLGTLTRRDDFVRDMQLTPAAFSILAFSVSKGTDRTPLAKFLRDNEVISLDENVLEVNGFNTIRVDILNKATKALWGSVYFSVEHGYTPVRYEYGRRGNQPVVRYDVTSLEKVSDGLWFPKSGYMERIGRERRTVFTAAKIVLNQGLGDDFFDFEFPPGTKIYDEILDLVYIFRPTEDEFNTWLEDQERLRAHEPGGGEDTFIRVDHGEKQVAADETATSPAPDTLQGPVNPRPQRSTQKPKATLLICGSIFLGAAALIILAVRRRSARRGTCS